MKLFDIFAVSILIVIVKGTWWAAAVNPVILSLGTVLASLDLDVPDLQSIEFQNLLPFINKQDKKEEK